MPEQSKTIHPPEIELNFFHHRWPRITTDIFVRNLCISVKSVVEFFEEGLVLIKKKYNQLPEEMPGVWLLQ